MRSNRHFLGFILVHSANAAHPAYVNRQYASGVGNDPRTSRQFNRALASLLTSDVLRLNQLLFDFTAIKQGNDYDPHGLYIKTWMPFLSSVPTHRIQNPWVMTLTEKKSYGVDLDSVAYPSVPVHEEGNWRPHYNRKPNGGGNGKLGAANPNERVKNLGPRGTREGGDRPDRGSTRGGRVGGASRGRGGGGGQRD